MSDCQASKSFDAIRTLIILIISYLCINTKRTVYNAVIISILLYGAKTWMLKAPDVCMLATFHNRCVRTNLGETRYSQWRECITTKQLSAQFGTPHSIAGCLLDRRLRLLGHLRIDDGRTHMLGKLF